MGETVMVKFDPGGTVTVIPGSISHGQGHETMYKILLSERLGIDEADIRVTHSDTDLAPDGGGTFASRTAVLGGSAATIAADKIIAKATKIAAHIDGGRRRRHRVRATASSASPAPTRPCR